MLVDSVTIIIAGGNGGNGAVTFQRTAQTAKAGPNGGNGGNGGSIFFQGSTNVSDLAEFQFRKKVVAGDGIDGRRKNLFGKNADHRTIFVPLGTQITDTETGEVVEITDITTSVLLARGGMGGMGNFGFRSATNQAPQYAELGTAGQQKSIHMELRIIAEIGLIGLPNAGKSSLLSALTNARPAIGSYPFTTLEPNIGMFGTHPIADIPGLIEGASKGKGLGMKFLKHIEKTKLLVHCIDVLNENPLRAYETVREEFRAYNDRLLKKPEILLLTKTDLGDERTIKKTMSIFQKQGIHTLTCSVYNRQSVKALAKELEKILANDV